MRLGPLEYTVIGFDKPTFDGSIAEEIGKVVEKRIIRIVDIVFVEKDAAGDVQIVEIDNVRDPRFAKFAPLLKDNMGFLPPEDVLALAEGLPAESAALILLFEHRWAEHLKVAIANAGGFLVARETISPEALETLNAEVEAIEELEEAEA
jgi:uncharacterized membrane protein